MDTLPTYNVGISHPGNDTRQSAAFLVRLWAAQTNPTHSSFTFNGLWIIFIWCEVQLSLHRNSQWKCPSEGIFYFTAWVNFRACTLLQLNQYSNSICTSTWVNNVYTFATTGSKSDKYFNTLNIRHRESSISMRIKTLIFKTIFTCYIDCFLLIYLFLNFFFFFYLLPDTKLLY